MAATIIAIMITVFEFVSIQDNADGNTSESKENYLSGSL